MSKSNAIMTASRRLLILVVATLSPLAHASEPMTTAAVLESLQESDWRQPDPDNTLYLRLADGEVIIELAPNFAPAAVKNIKTFVKERFYDDLAVIRSQDNYVVQWGDPAADTQQARELGIAATSVPPEYFLPAGDVEFIAVDSRDAYADRVGFVDGFPAAGNDEEVWLTHCYGMLGVARGDKPDSGIGSSLYVVTGHAPRHLDRNIALVGRVLSGIENLTTLPRGTGALGFYESAAEQHSVVNIRLGSQLRESERRSIKVLRTDTAAFNNYALSRTFRNEDWFVEPTGRIEICNISPPVEID